MTAVSCCDGCDRFALTERCRNPSLTHTHARKSRRERQRFTQSRLRSIFPFTLFSPPDFFSPNPQVLDIWVPSVRLLFLPKSPKKRAYGPSTARKEYRRGGREGECEQLLLSAAVDEVGIGCFHSFLEILCICPAIIPPATQQRSVLCTLTHNPRARDG